MEIDSQNIKCQARTFKRHTWNTSRDVPILSHA
jgi:hypothetical protein